MVTEISREKSSLSFLDKLLFVSHYFRFRCISNIGKKRIKKSNYFILYRYETNLTPKNEGILQDYETERKKNLPRPRGKPEGNKKVSEVDTGQGGKI